MGDFAADWVNWLLEGASLLSPGERGRLLSRCGERCAQTGILEVYRKLFLDCGGDPDRFFSRLSEIPGVSGAVIEPGRTYEIAFEGCLCDLHTENGVDSPALCECSRGSVAHVMSTLMPGRTLRVIPVRTILGGASECRFRVGIKGDKP